MSADYSLFIARRLMRTTAGERRLSGPVIKVATAAVALGVAVMMVSLAVGIGFKKEVRDKIVGFGTHVQIVSFDYNRSYETNPIDYDTVLCRQVMAVDGVRHVQPFIVKPGIIKTDDAIQGLALKGIDRQFDNTFLSSIMEEGDTLSLPDTAKSSGMVLSRTLADALKLSLGDPVRMYFIQNGIRARRFELVGIFNSHFPEFDERMAYVDMRQLTGLNGWTDGQISGYEVMLSDFDRMIDAADEISYIASAELLPDNTFLRTLSIVDLQPQIFGWLNLLDMNIAVILVLIIAVAGLNMISGLLILILENTNTIGMLKAMGCPGARIRRIFLYMAARIVGRGMLWGNILGLALCMLQKFTGIVALDPENYYLDTVPILLTPLTWLLLNIATAAVTTLMLIGPSYVASRISPAKSIRFN